MNFHSYVDQLIAFVRDNAAWAPPIVFALAFGESLAFISLLIPAWGALVAIGALIGPSGVNFWPVWVAAALGAAFGDWLSYWIGLKLEYSVAHIWPLSRHPELIPRGEAFMKKWGIPGIFIGRFFGPLRAAVPLIAGIFEMPFWRFQIGEFLVGLGVGRRAAHDRRRHFGRREVAVRIVLKKIRREFAPGGL